MRDHRRCAPLAAAVSSALALVASVLAVAALTTVAAPSAAAAPVGTIVTYNATSIHAPSGITAGPDGNMWFANSASDTIGRVTAIGQVTSYPGSGIDGPNDVTPGPDGNLWFTNYTGSSIGRITPTGTVTTFTAASVNHPYEIAAAWDGNLWFTNKGGNSIGRITPTGAITNFTGANISAPSGIVAGPDGNLWFTNQGNNRIGRITTFGSVSTFSDAGIDGAYAITAGPDGNVWFTNWSAHPAIGRITPVGVIDLFTAPGVSAPASITAGADGNLWFANYGGNSLGRATTSGSISTIANTGPGAVWSIAGGPDGDVWFTNLGDNSVARITAQAGSTFHPLAPTRILDSRTSTGGWGSPLVAGSQRLLGVTGGSTGVPSAATAVVLNVTVTGGTANSFVTAFPTGSPKPTSSNVNFAAGETRPNLVTVKVGRAGQVTFANAIGSVDVIADIAGYFRDDVGSGYHPLIPTRILDSRTATGGWSAPLTAATPRQLQVRGAGGVPDTADTVVLNVTATNATANSYLKIYGSGSMVLPNVSNLNFAAGQTIPNLVIVRLGTGGRIVFANAVGSVDVIADVAGYFDPTGGAVFHPLTPARVLDSRTPLGGWNTKLVAGTPRAIVASATGGVGPGTSALLANTTATGSTANSFLTVFPSGSSPTTSNLNFAAGETAANLVPMTVGPTGLISFATSSGATDVVVDVAGYFAAS